MNHIIPYNFLRISIGCAVLCLCTLYAQNSQCAENNPITSISDTTSEQFILLNVIWFKLDGGEAKYMEYLAAAGPIAAEYGGEVLDAYVPETALIGHLDADLMFYVTWPNQETFTKFVQDTDYQAVSHLREEAIRNSLLIRCRRLVLQR